MAASVSGLRSVRHLVEMHGGTVEAQSDGEGAARRSRSACRCWALAPSSRSRRCRRSMRCRCATQTDGALAGVSIVVVDDDKDARDLISTTLVHAGANVLLRQLDVRSVERAAFGHAAGDRQRHRHAQRHRLRADSRDSPDRAPREDPGDCADRVRTSGRSRAGARGRLQLSHHQACGSAASGAGTSPPRSEAELADLAPGSRRPRSRASRR